MPATPAATGSDARPQPPHLTTDAARASFVRHLPADSKAPPTVETYLDAGRLRNLQNLLTSST